jgi:hypothetical protein
VLMLEGRSKQFRRGPKSSQRFTLPNDYRSL